MTHFQEPSQFLIWVGEEEVTSLKGHNREKGASQCETGSVYSRSPTTLLCLGTRRKDSTSLGLSSSEQSKNTSFGPGKH